MENQEQMKKESRRNFLGAVAANAAMLGVGSFLTPLQTAAAPFLPPGNDIKDADAWFNKVKGKHRVVFDATRPHEMMPFAWPRVFLLTNQASGTAESDCGVVVVLRHEAIPYAMDNSLWAKYNFGEVFKADDPKTKKPATRNPFQNPANDDFKVPGFGIVHIGINELQASGVMFCVCDAAMTVYSAALAEPMKMEAAAIKQEWLSGLLPGIQPVPSGVWALGRAQEHGCSYIFAG